jgi:hypothetical protein
MSKKCAQPAENQLEKPVHFLPQYPPYFAASSPNTKVRHSSHQFVPTIHKQLSHVVHSYVDGNNRGQSEVIPLLHTAYYYYY